MKIRSLAGRNTSREDGCLWVVTRQLQRPGECGAGGPGVALGVRRTSPRRWLLSGGLRSR